jgi:hypothetical protein
MARTASKKAGKSFSMYLDGHTASALEARADEANISLAQMCAGILRDFVECIGTDGRDLLKSLTDAMTSAGRPLTPMDLSKRIGEDHRSVLATLRGMFDRGEVTRGVFKNPNGVTMVHTYSIKPAPKAEAAPVKPPEGLLSKFLSTLDKTGGKPPTDLAVFASIHGIDPSAVEGMFVHAKTVWDEERDAAYRGIMTGSEST